MKSSLIRFIVVVVFFATFTVGSTYAGETVVVNTQTQGFIKLDTPKDGVYLIKYTWKKDNIFYVVIQENPTASGRFSENLLIASPKPIPTIPGEYFDGIHLLIQGASLRTYNVVSHESRQL
ncbi:MAG: hypothetical protein WCF92_03445 [bacterium]